MPNEPLALPEHLAGLPDAADYDVVLAAIMASERGRRFLSEFAKRNRNADTTMVVAAIARVEAAIRGDAAPQAAAAGTGDLVEIAAAVDRIAAAIAAGTTRTSDTAAAIERIQDIAFMLHERPLEATLRDSFDAAVRELATAAARIDADADATALLHTLASRVREMIAARLSSAPAADFLQGAADNGEALARAVAAFAASLPTLAEVLEPTSDAPRDVVAAPSDREGEAEQAPAEPQHDGETIAIVTATEPAEDGATVAEVMVAEAVEKPTAEPQHVHDDTVPLQQPATEISGSAAILSQAFADDHFSGAAGEAPADDVQPGEPVPSQESSSEAEPPAQEFSVEPVADPEEDPAELFEPQPAPTPLAESTIEATAPVVASASAAAAPPEPPQIVPPPPTRAVPRPPLSDPLAAVRDLSEEELIALFG
jgi:hypothetical protein